MQAILLYVMKRRSNYLVLFFLLTLFITGCGIHGNVTAPIQNAPDINLYTNNFKVVGTASASTSATYILGVGGLSKRAVQSNAVADMIANANLTGAQMITNVTYRTSCKMVPPFWVKYYVFVSGTIIEFIDVDSPTVSTRVVEKKNETPVETDTVMQELSIADNPLSGKIVEQSKSDNQISELNIYTPESVIIKLDSIIRMLSSEFPESQKENCFAEYSKIVDWYRTSGLSNVRIDSKLKKVQYLFSKFK